MSRSTFIPALIVCLGLTFAAVGYTAQDAATLAVKPKQDQAPTVADFQSLVQRVEKLERQLSARKEQEQLGRGFLAIDPIVANLDEGRLTRYIRVSIVLSIEDGQKQSALTALAEIDPKIKDWIYGFLSDKTLDDVRGRDNQQKLRVDIQAGINSQLKSAGYSEFAKAVLFDEINIQ